MALVVDGFISLLDGMNSGIAPELIKDTAYSKGINVTSRNGLIRTRPGFVKVAELGSGVFQGAGKWSLNSGDRLVYVLSGRVYSYRLDSGVITDFGVLLDPMQSVCYFCQVDRWLVIQDGVSRPVVLFESEISGLDELYGRDAPKVCLCPGTIMQYAHQRLHYVTSKVHGLTPDPETLPDVVPDLVVPELSGKMQFVSSDVRDIFNPEYVFRMSEHRVLNEGGGGFGTPLELGFITAMGVFRNFASGNGLGALLVFGREGICAFDVSIQRSQWLGSGVNIAQVLYVGAGTESPFSVVSANDDVFYLDAQYMLRTVRYDKSKLAGSGGVLSNTPLSNEMRYFVDKSAKEYLPWASAALHENRISWTMCGAAGPYFKALGVLDLAQVYGIGGADSPSFDGVWTGFKFLREITARYAKNERLYVFVKSTNDTVSLLYNDASAYYDIGNVAVESQLYTKLMSFPKAPADLKQLRFIDIWLSDIYTPVNMAVYYRPSHSSIWSLAAVKSINVPAGGLPQFRRALRFGIDYDSTECDTLTNEKLYNGVEFQFCIKWTGHCAITKGRAVAEVVGEAPAACEEDNIDNIIEVDSGLLSDFSYEVPM
jgi:hypothetical protein